MYRRESPQQSISLFFVCGRIAAAVRKPNMSIFLDVAYKVLKSEQRPLTAMQIADIGQAQ